MATNVINPKKTGKQFSYCTLCKTNHTLGRKHIYTNKHKETTDKAINRFILRISEGDKVLEAPVIGDCDDLERTFWCYACQSEIKVHQKLDGIVVQCSGMINHLSSLTHSAKLKKFFQLNGIDRNLMTKCYFTQQQLGTFMSLSSKARKQFTEARKEQLKRDTQHLKELETNRKRLLDDAISKIDYSQTQPSTSSTLPPWLQNDSPTIGPSQLDLDKQKKLKLPANRVGANFDRSSVSEDWLPSFGRVWNHGRRLESKRAFTKNLQKKFQ